MALELVADYRNLRPFVQDEVVRALSVNRDLFPGCDFMTTVNLIEQAWLADCIESSTLLSVSGNTSIPVLRTLHEMDRSNILRGRLFKLITACGYHHVPESELRLEIRPTGLYLISS